jgi:hypothetical protein
MTIVKNTNRIPSICKLRYLFINEIRQMDYSCDQFHKWVYLIGSASWREIYFTPGSAEFTEVQKQETAGLLFNQTLRFFFPGEDDGNTASFDALISRPVVFGIEYSNQKIKLLGSVDRPARLFKSFKTDSKGSTCEFTAICQDNKQAFWLASAEI